MNSVPQLADFYYTIRDVAQSLQVSHSTAYSLACAGLLGPPAIVGRTHLYPRATAERAIETRRQQIIRSGLRAPLAGAE